MPQLKRVRFQAELSTVHILEDHIRKSEAEDVWYTREYLNWAHDEDSQNFLQTHTFLKTCPRFVSEEEYFESEEMTSRGLEKILGNKVGKRQEKRMAHIRSVVKKYAKTKNAETTRSFAKTSSKADRQKAQKLGEEDEVAVLGRVVDKKTKKESSNSSVFSFKTKTRVPFSLRGSSREFSDDWLLQ